MKSCFLLLLLTAVNVTSKKLIQTNVVYRHGDRAPVGLYPNDVHKADSWPDGLGMLTHVGREQHTRLGKFFRKRYENFLSRNFDTKEIHIKSSDMDRTLMSAYSNLAGLYSTNNSAVWNGDFILMQPIPVHTVPKEQDQLLRMSRHCDALEAKKDGIFNMTGVAEQLRKDYSKFYSMLSELTGVSTDYFDAPLNLDHIRDPLFCERQHNLTLPVWVGWTNITCGDNTQIICKDKTVYEIMTQFREHHYQITADAEEIYRYYGGPLVIDILDNFEKIVAKPGEMTKFNVYSAHDTTVAALLSALGVYNGLSPQYTATVLLELYLLDGGDYQVEIHYKNITDVDSVYQLDIPGCEPQCSLTDFKQKYESLRIIDWDEACANGHKSLNKEEVVTISVCITLVVCLTLIAVICYTRRKRITHSYTKIRA